MVSEYFSKARIVKLGFITRLLVPTLFLQSISKRSVALAFLRHRLMLPIAIISIVSWLVMSALFYPIVGELSYLIFFWLIGSSGVLILFNNTTHGFVFVKPVCYECKFRDVIIRHEMLHLQGVVKEEQVWRTLRRVYESGAMKIEYPSKICSYCPIPERIIDLR